MSRTLAVALILCILAAPQPVMAGDVNSHDGKLSFIVIGDWGMHGSRGQKRVAAAMDALAARTRIDFIISTGDNFYPAGVYGVDDPLWKRSFINVYNLPHLRTLPWYVTLGNHDYLGDIHAEMEYAQNNPRWHLPATYYQQAYSSDPPLARFFFLDTNAFIDKYHARPGRYHHINEQDPAAQLQWLRGELQHSTAVWKIAVGHHPVYSSGRRHGDTEKLKKALPPLFEEFGVQAYFSGHDHILEYYRPQGRTGYIISGAGAAHRTLRQRRYSLFAASTTGFVHVALARDNMTVRFIDADGNELYKYSVAPE
jgi:tartrate-resistant acid phosphatase type 5